MNNLKSAYETISIRRTLHNWDKNKTLRALADELRDEIAKGIYTEEQKNEMRGLYVMEGLKYS